jgi:hypothetical protein
MLRPIRVLLATTLALGAATPAAAAGLVSATWTQSLQGVDITLTNDGSTCASTNPNVIQQTVTIGGASCLNVANPNGLGATGSATATSYSVSLTLPSFALRQFTTGGAINIATKAAIGGMQTITGNATSAQANVGIPGMVTVKAAAHIGKGANASMLTSITPMGANTLVLVPLSVGKAGTFTDYFNVLGSYSFITVDFYAWTTGTFTFMGLTSKGVLLPDVTAMGSRNLTPNGGGTVTLVSPSKISIDGDLSRRRTASYTTLTLVFPEPGTLLLGAAAAGLLLLRRRAA